LILSKSETPEKFGVAITDENGNVLNVEEKPEKPRSKLVITGLYFFKPTIFQFIKKVRPSERGELEITQAIQDMVTSNNYKVVSSVADGWWDDTGTPESVLRANRLVLAGLKPLNKGILENNVKTIGNIEIGERTIIKENTVIVGPAIIGRDCIVGPNSCIGPYTSIGDSTKIIGGEIESSIVVGGATINFSGKIVNIGSMAAKHEVEGESLYTSTKAAVVSFTRVLAKEVNRYGITCNVLAPAAIPTELSAQVNQEKLKEVLSRNAISDYGKFSDVSNATDWLIKDESNAVTGQTIYLGGV